MPANPYEVLGVNENASLDEIRAAYRRLALEYQSDELSGNPLSADAQKKMDIINEAYDNIIIQRGGSGSDKKRAAYNSSYTYSDNHSNYSDVRNLLSQNRIEEAETILDGVYKDSRDAEWYYLRGKIYHRKGWLEEAYKSYSKACKLDPDNEEYRFELNSFNNSAAGGYKTSSHMDKNSSDCCCCCNPCDCSGCDICSSLICADCCCECTGGDLIKCI